MRLQDMPEYTVWAGMNQRCRDPNAVNYARYGARGIVVCEAWRSPGGFTAFIRDMGRRPSPKHQIDRIDPSGNYEPGNCRWVEHEEQVRNRRSNINVTIDGNTMCVSDWCAKTGVPEKTAYARISAGWDRVRAVTDPVITVGRIVVDGEEMSSKEACSRFGISPGALSNRLYRGWPADDAVKAPQGTRFSTWTKTKTKPEEM